MGLKDDILSADDKRLVQVSVPEWGVHVWIRTMTGAELCRYLEEAFTINSEGSTAKLQVAQRLLLALTLCDESGARLFTTEDDIQALSEKTGAPLARLFQQASDINGLTKESFETLSGN